MLKLYIDWISQPSRTVKAVVDILKVDYQLVPLKIEKKEHKTPEFTKLNPLQQVPIIQDGDFILAESHTIMKYIIRSRNIQTNLYPYDNIKQTAKIDEYLDYHHTNNRIHSFGLYLNKLIHPKFNQELYTKTDYYEYQVNQCLTHLNDNLLSKHEYLCGDKVTLADISAVSEFMQLHMIRYDFSKYKNVDQWMYKVFKIPEVEAAHFVAMKIIKKQHPECRFLQ